MKKEKIMLGEFKLMGIAKHGRHFDKGDKLKLFSEFLDQEIPKKIKHRCHPEITYVVYTSVQNSSNNEHTLFVGEEVSAFQDIDKQPLSSLVIPESQYQKFTTEPGVFPDIIESTWELISNLNDQELQGKRTYHADFEIYDHRAVNPHFSIVDIYLGIS